jgi:transcriptional regulator with XRE-family HTH domain
MSTPNLILRDVRNSLRMSQEDLARAIRQDGQRTGDVNNCSKRLVQRWEAGVITAPRGGYARALEHVTGLPISNLGFADQQYGVDRDAAMTTGIWLDDDPKATGPYTGIWKSWYEYPSSSRNATYSSEHYVILIQHGARIQVRSVPAAESRVVMDLAVNGTVVTGTWSEETSTSGYYSGGVYFGAIQMLAEPTGHRLAGKWLGFGRDFDVNVGPWSLTLVSNDTSRETVARYNRTPESGDTAKADTTT